MGNTMVLRRKFSPAECLADIERTKASVLVVVPVMLQCMLKLPAKECKHDTSSLRIIAASGSAIGAPLVKKVLKEFGPVLYNLYGSTEVSWVSIDTPAELQDHPDTAGRAPAGTPAGGARRGRPPGRRGRRRQRNAVRGLHPRRRGQGGRPRDDVHRRLGPPRRRPALHRRSLRRHGDLRRENVYPGEVEDLINELDGVREVVVVVGVDDEKFGARLAAYVVREPNSGGDPVDSDSIRAHVKAGLARFSVPRDVVFLDELPRNATARSWPATCPCPPSKRSYRGQGS